MSEHFLIDVFVEHTDNLAIDGLIRQFPFLEGELYLCLSHILHVARRVNEEHALTLFVGNPLVVYLVVVSEEDDVEAWYLVCNGCRSVLFVLIGDDTTVLARVEQSKEQIGLLLLLDILHPFLGAAYHLLKLETFPDGFVQPVRDGWCQHTDDTDLHTVLVMNRVGVNTCIDMFWLCYLSVLVFLLDDVSTQQRTTNLTDPFVIDLVSWFDIMVANGLSVILHVVDDGGSQILVLRHHIIRPVDTWLSLKDITIVNQQQVVAILLSLFINICIGTHECTFQGLLLHEVVREEMAVYIAGLDDLQTDGLRGRLGIDIQQHTECDD